MRTDAYRRHAATDPRNTWINKPTWITRNPLNHWADPSDPGDPYKKNYRGNNTSTCSLRRLARAQNEPAENYIEFGPKYVDCLAHLDQSNNFNGLEISLRGSVIRDPGLPGSAPISPGRLSKFRRVPASGARARRRSKFAQRPSVSCWDYNRSFISEPAHCSSLPHISDTVHVRPAPPVFSLAGAAQWLLISICQPLGIIRRAVMPRGSTYPNFTPNAILAPHPFLQRRVAGNHELSRACRPGLELVIRYALAGRHLSQPRRPIRLAGAVDPSQ